MDDELVKDIVCGMEIEKSSSESSVEYNGAWYYFCSEHCKQKFLASPEKYTKETQE